MEGDILAVWEGYGYFGRLQVRLSLIQCLLFCFIFAIRLSHIHPYLIRLPNNFICRDDVYDDTMLSYYFNFTIRCYLPFPSLLFSVAAMDLNVNSLFQLRIKSTSEEVLMLLDVQCGKT